MNRKIQKRKYWLAGVVLCMIVTQVSYGGSKMAEGAGSQKHESAFVLHSQWGDIAEHDIAHYDGADNIFTLLLSKEATDRLRTVNADWLNFSAPEIGGSEWTIRLGGESVLTAEFVEGIAARIPSHPYFQFFNWPDGRLGLIFFPGVDSGPARPIFANAHKRLRAHFARMGKICQRWSDAEVQRWLDSCYRPVSIEPRGDPKSDTPVPLRLHLRGVRTGHYWAMIMVQEPGIERGGHVVATKRFDVTKPEESVELMPDAMNWSAVTQRRDRGGSWNVALWPKLTVEEADGLGPLRLWIPFGETSAPTTPTSFPWQ